jgi:hypothetical protein
MYQVNNRPPAKSRKHLTKLAYFSGWAALPEGDCFAVRELQSAYNRKFFHNVHTFYWKRFGSYKQNPHLFAPG